MPLAQTRLYTEDDYYNLPENVRAELIDGYLIYNQAAPSRIHQSILRYTFQDKIKVNIYEDLWIDFAGLEL